MLRLLGIGLVLVLLGCSNAADKATNTPTQRPDTTIKGNLFTTLGQSGEVSLYGYNDFNRGSQIGETVNTDNLGYYEFNINQPAGPLLLVAKSGTKETAYTVVNHIPGEDLVANISELTALHAGLASYYHSLNDSEAISKASTDTLVIFGFDPVKETIKDPYNSTSTATNLTNAHEYGFIVAAYKLAEDRLHAATANETVSRILSDSMGKMIFQDAQDGLLDGNTDSGSNVVGSVVVGTEYHRHILAINILTVAQSAENLTGFGSTTLIPLATRINNSTIELFGQAGVIPIDESGPSITSITPESGSVVFGSFSINVDAFDITGISKVEVKHGGNIISTGQANTPMVIDTDIFGGDGTISLQIVATSNLNRVVTSNLTVEVANNQTTVANLSFSENDYFSKTLTVSADVNDPIGVTKTEVKVANSNYQVAVDAKKPFASFDISGFTDGAYDVVIRVTNTAGTVKLYTYRINIDNTDPVISSVSPNQGFFNGSVDILPVVSEGALDKVELLVDGQVTDSILAGTNPTVFTISTADVKYGGEGTHNLTVRAIDKANNIALFNFTLTFDNTGPVFSNVNIQNNDFLRGSTQYSATVSDNASSVVSTKLHVVNSLGGSTEVAVAPDSVNASFDIDTAGVFFSGDGVYKLVMEATNSAGISSSIERTVTIDNTPPVLGPANPIQGGYSNKPFNLTMSANDNTAISTIVAKIGDLVLINQGTNNEIDILVNPGVLGLGDGSYEVIVTVEDQAGNTVSYNHNFVWDVTPPVAIGVAVDPNSARELFPVTGNEPFFYYDWEISVRDTSGIKSIALCYSKTNYDMSATGNDITVRTVPLYKDYSDSDPNGGGGVFAEGWPYNETAGTPVYIEDMAGNIAIYAQNFANVSLTQTGPINLIRVDTTAVFDASQSIPFWMSRMEACPNHIWVEQTSIHDCCGMRELVNGTWRWVSGQTNYPDPITWEQGQ